MPPLGTSWRRRRAELRARDVPVEDHTKSADLTGWDAIQESMLKHDERMINDFIDEINTLLVIVRPWSLDSHVLNS